MLFVEQKYKLKKQRRNRREINVVLQLKQELGIKNKTMMSWSAHKKKEYIFCNVYFVRSNFFSLFVFYLNV